jgi:hypothetical protein
VENEIGKAFAKVQALMKERKEKVLALVPLDLDAPGGTQTAGLERQS